MDSISATNLRTDFTDGLESISSLDSSYSYTFSSYTSSEGLSKRMRSKMSQRENLRHMVESEPYEDPITYVQQWLNKNILEVELKEDAEEPDDMSDIESDSSGSFYDGDQSGSANSSSSEEQRLPRLLRDDYNPLAEPDIPRSLVEVLTFPDSLLSSTEETGLPRIMPDDYNPLDSFRPSALEPDIPRSMREILTMPSLSLSSTEETEIPKSMREVLSIPNLSLSSTEQTDLPRILRDDYNPLDSPLPSIEEMKARIKAVELEMANLVENAKAKKHEYQMSEIVEEEFEKTGCV